VQKDELTPCGTASESHFDKVCRAVARRRGPGESEGIPIRDLRQRQRESGPIVITLPVRLRLKLVLSAFPVGNNSLGLLRC
jgi:hypothetical protein